jgi:hypothetical protein
MKVVPHAVLSGADAATSVLASVEAKVMSWSNEEIIVLAASFLDMMESMDDSKLEGNVVPIVFKVLLEGSAPVVKAWLPVLATLVPLLSLEYRTKQLMAILAKKASWNSTGQGRFVAAELCAAMCRSLGAESPKALVEAGLPLCQDTDLKVRKSMCGALGPLALAMGEEVARQRILPELQELLRDEEASVRREVTSCLLPLASCLLPLASCLLHLPVHLLSSILYLPSSGIAGARRTTRAPLSRMLPR